MDDNKLIAIVSVAVSILGSIAIIAGIAYDNAEKARQHEIRLIELQRGETNVVVR